MSRERKSLLEEGLWNRIVFDLFCKHGKYNELDFEKNYRLEE